jgi:Zn-dependent protease with chaperone function
MHLAVAISLAVVVSCGALAFAIPRHFPPESATHALTLLAMLSAIAAVWTLLIVAGADVVQIHGIAERLSLCSELVASHRGTLTPLGLIALVAFLTSCAAVVHKGLQHRRLRVPKGTDGLAIVSSDIPTAFTLPGRPGSIVVSSAMLRELDACGRRVLLAHERAHLRCRHHRFIFLTQLAASALPLLTPLNARMRYFTERWADEEAALEVGSRRAVATAIARAALTQTGVAPGSLAIADTGVVQRVESLLADAPEPAPSVQVGIAAMLTTGAAALSLSVLLIEPLITELLGFCH